MTFSLWKLSYKLLYTFIAFDIWDILAQRILFCKDFFAGVIPIFS
jgi:hypothetical protein